METGYISSDVWTIRMDNLVYGKLIIMKIVIILVLCLFWTGCDSYIGSRDRTINEASRLVELAYFEGQRDALEGDIRIKYDEQFKCWRWIKTPWNNGSPAKTDLSGMK